MEIKVHTDDHIKNSEDFIEKYSDLFTKKLHRFSAYITTAEIFFTDENKAKPGIDDKKCTIEVKIKSRPAEAVSHNANTLKLAFDGAMDKMKNLLDSRIGKLHEK
jgi:hypothetical protein